MTGVKDYNVKGIRLGNYELIEELGRGTFGVVYKAKKYNDESGELFAIKSMARDDKVTSATREQDFAKHQKDKHKNIINIIEFLPSPKKPRDYLVMEYCAEGDLNDYIIVKNPPFPTKVAFMLDMARGVEYLHKNKVIHRDLKPQNILLTRYKGEIICKITDFGISKIQQSGSDLFSTIVGTKLFTAPEVFTGMYSYSADVYSLGLLYMAIVVRNIATLPEKYLLPMVKVNGEDLAINMLRIKYPEKKKDIIKDSFPDSRKLGELVNSMLEVPSRRPELDGAFIDQLVTIQEEVRLEKLRQIDDTHQEGDSEPMYIGELETQLLITKYEQLGLLPTEAKTVEEAGKRNEIKADTSTDETDLLYTWTDMDTEAFRTALRSSRLPPTIVGLPPPLRTEIQRLALENEDTLQNKKAAEDKVRKLEAELIKLRSDYSLSKATNIRLEASSKTLQKELDTTNETVGKLQDENRGLRRRLREKEDQLEDMQMAKEECRWPRRD